MSQRSLYTKSGFKESPLTFQQISASTFQDMEYYIDSDDDINSATSHGFAFDVNNWGFTNFYVCGYSVRVRNADVLCLTYSDKIEVTAQIETINGEEVANELGNILIGREDFWESGGWFLARGYVDFNNPIEVETNEQFLLYVGNRTGVNLAAIDAARVCVWGYSTD